MLPGLPIPLEIQPLGVLFALLCSLGRVAALEGAAYVPMALSRGDVLVYDATSAQYPPTYDAGWSNFYARYPRRADLNHIIAPYVAAQGYERVAGVGEVGWFGKATDPFGQPLPEPLQREGSDPMMRFFSFMGSVTSLVDYLRDVTFTLDDHTLNETFCCTFLVGIFYI